MPFFVNNCTENIILLSKGSSCKAHEKPSAQHTEAYVSSSVIDVQRSKCYLFITKLVEGAFWCKQRIPKINRHIQVITVFEPVFCDGEADRSNDGAIHNGEVSDILPIICYTRFGTTVHGVEGGAQIEVIP